MLSICQSQAMLTPHQTILPTSKYSPTFLKIVSSLLPQAMKTQPTPQNPAIPQSLMVLCQLWDMIRTETSTHQATMVLMMSSHPAKISLLPKAMTVNTPLKVAQAWHLHLCLLSVQLSAFVSKPQAVMQMALSLQDTCLHHQKQMSSSIMAMICQSLMDIQQSTTQSQKHILIPQALKSPTTRALLMVQPSSAVNLRT